jgi:hypothetical protein
MYVGGVIAPTIAFFSLKFFMGIAKSVETSE